MSLHRASRPVPRGDTRPRASATGIAVSTVSEVLAGKRRLDRKHIEPLAAHFGVIPAVFLEG